MATYGQGGRISSARPLKTSPKSLQIRKKGPGCNPILFSQLRQGSEEGLSTEEFVSSVHYKAHLQAQNREAATLEGKPQVIDEVYLQDFVRKAPNSCRECRELIPGNEARQVRITVTIPSVGAEATEYDIESTCQKCFDAHLIAKVRAVPDADWKQKLKPGQLEVWNLYEAGESQKSIADRLDIGQPDVSKRLAACRKIRDTFSANFPT